MGLAEYLKEKSSVTVKELDRLLPSEDEQPRNVHRSMRYSVLLPGKRLRPVIMLAIGEMFRADEKLILPAACAVEMVHCASLILDDLPCMDDALLRRGGKANHLVFGEDIAVLAAFNLLNLAFKTIAGIAASGTTSLKKINEAQQCFNSAVGSNGLIGGQALDLEGEGKKLNFNELEFIHSRKTGALFTESGNIACILSGAREKERTAIGLYTKNLGLAFQVVDDILDVTSSPDALGKDTAKDARKTTFVSFSTIEEARNVASELIEFSVDALSAFGRKGERLRQIAYFVRDRKI